jgi:hypothetical protein
LDGKDAGERVCGLCDQPRDLGGALFALIELFTELSGVGML